MTSSNESDAPDNAGDAVRRMAVRPSTTRRAGKLRLLLDELALRELDVAAAAALLQVSSSSVRNYLHELHDAGIAAPSADAGGRWVEASVYRLCADADRVRDFLAQVAAARMARARPANHNPVWRNGGCLFHIMGDDVKFALSAGSAHPRRDPLVAALFGATGQPGKGAS